MNETEFTEASNKLMALVNTQGWPAAETELKLINRKLQAEHQRMDFRGATHLGAFFLYDTRTNEELYRCNLGSLKNWPGSPFSKIRNV
jgi:hypothetical protein